MTRLQKSIAHTLLDLAFELGHHYAFSVHTQGIHLFRDPDCKSTDALYLDAPEEELINKLDKIVKQAYEL